MHIRKTLFESGDPTAIYEAIEYCYSQNLNLPGWLNDELKNIISRYYTNKSPGSIGSGKTPLAKTRNRQKADVRYRAVTGVREWQKNQLMYQLMPRQSIKAWFNGDLDKYGTNLVDAFEIAKEGLWDTFAECGTSTLKNVFYENVEVNFPGISSELGCIFELDDPDELFGSDIDPPQHIKLLLNSIADNSAKI